MGDETMREAAAWMRTRAEMKLTAASRHPPRSVYRTTAEDDAARYRRAADAIEALAAATERAETFASAPLPAFDNAPAPAANPALLGLARVLG